MIHSAICETTDSIFRINLPVDTLSKSNFLFQIKSFKATKRADRRAYFREKIFMNFLDNFHKNKLVETLTFLQSFRKLIEIKRYSKQIIVLRVNTRRHHGCS